MIEAIVFFGLGYFFARIIQAPFRPDLLLCWDRDCFGWRPVVNPKRINPNERYLAAIEIDPETWVPPIDSFEA